MSLFWFYSFSDRLVCPSCLWGGNCACLVPHDIVVQQLWGLVVSRSLGSDTGSSIAGVRLHQGSLSLAQQVVLPSLCSLDDLLLSEGNDCWLIKLLCPRAAEENIGVLASESTVQRQAQEPFLGWRWILEECNHIESWIYDLDQVPLTDVWTDICT